MTIIILSLTAVLILAPSSAIADNTDWVNPSYLVQQSLASAASRQTTEQARKAIINGADTFAKKGPYSVTNSKDMLPPSKDAHDYLSWAPYHWPNCNWCTSGRGDSEDSNNIDGATTEALQMHFNNSADPLLIGSDISCSNNGQLTEILAVSKTKKEKGPKCTPSPTKPMAPSATWTTCPYIVKDGQANPDVQQLKGPGAINNVAQAVLYNSIAFTVNRNSAYSSTSAKLIVNFFLDPSSRINPNMNFGQIVRGPGSKGQEGTFTGVLDLRGLVKIVNGVLALKAAQSSDWTDQYQEKLTDWMTTYVKWLKSNPVAKKTSTRPNNHGTFYYSQLAVTGLLTSDRSSSVSALTTYFDTIFKDQIAASGEQPFEAVRTRPFHYRCFNLEAMIVNAKIGDQLGLNFWQKRSKYGATIQTAVDFTMRVNPKSEKVAELVPHVATVAAVYGDPSGKYAAFMRKAMENYQSKPFWFYNQPSAYRSNHGKDLRAEQIPTTFHREQDLDLSITRNKTVTHQPKEPRTIDYDCPAIFRTEAEAEIDNGIFVTCAELEPFFLLANEVTPDGPIED